jgi:hypothetical protein
VTPLTACHLFRECARRARLWFLVPAVTGVALVAFGRARGIDAHRFYGSALMLPFFFAALMGSASDLAFHRRIGPAAPGTSKASVLLATFAWCVICLSAMVVVEWAASRAGLLGRTPNDWLDSVGMVLAPSMLISIMAMLARRLER